MHCCNISIRSGSDCKRQNVSKACLFYSCLSTFSPQSSESLSEDVVGKRHTKHVSPFDSVAFCGLWRITKSTEHNLLFSKKSLAIPSRSARARHEMMIFTLPRFKRRKLDDLGGESFVFDLQRVITAGYHRWSASKTCVHFHYKDRFRFPVVIDHFRNSLSSSAASVFPCKSFITAWQVRAEKKNFV